MANMRYGLKEVANVTFFDVATGKPAIFFDTLKVATIENESESAEARGGQGNGRLIAWDYNRTATLQIQDALLSDVSLAMLAGTAVKTSNIVAHGRETLTVSGNGVTLKETPINGTVHVYKVTNGVLQDEVSSFTVTGKDIDFTAGVADGDQVMVFYQYNVTSTDAVQITFSADKFPSIYRVVGDTIVRGQDGIDRKMQFVIPKAKLQSGFSLTMNVEEVSTFDFNLDVLVEAGTNKLYDIIRL